PVRRRRHNGGRPSWYPLAASRAERPRRRRRQRQLAADRGRHDHGARRRPRHLAPPPLRRRSDPPRPHRNPWAVAAGEGGMKSDVTTVPATPANGRPYPKGGNAMIRGTLGRTILAAAIVLIATGSLGQANDKKLLWVQPMRDHPVHRLMQQGFL